MTPKLQFILDRDATFNDESCSDFLGMWTKEKIILSLPSIADEVEQIYGRHAEQLIILWVGDVILHEYLHHILDEIGIKKGHHFAIDNLI